MVHNNYSNSDHEGRMSDFFRTLTCCPGSNDSTCSLSFAVQPLFPQVCQKVSVYTETTPEQGLSPVTLSNQLNSLPCSLQDPCSIFLLVMEVSHTLLKSSLWKTNICCTSC